jgi:alpha-tubulin suppressor-like RCC1 family protein
MMSHIRLLQRALYLLLFSALVVQGCASAITDNEQEEDPIADPTGVKLVVAGAHTCALTNAGQAYCWGFNSRGQLGNNDTGVVNSTPIPVAGGLKFQSLAVSNIGAASCGITTTGAAYCWGENTGGRLGDGTTVQRLSPTPVAGGLVFTSLSVGAQHTCGLVANGNAYCWGTTLTGALGTGVNESRMTPVRAAPNMTFKSITTGIDFTCGLTREVGVAYCWGSGFIGQLGDGLRTSSYAPAQVSGAHAFQSLAAGTSTVCGVTTVGRAYCWGQNFFGTVGDSTRSGGNVSGLRLTPVAVVGGLTFKGISSGAETTCGVTTTGTGYCWGYNFGAVGDGTTEHRASPSPVAGGLTFQTISSGTSYSCGIATTKALYCWGDNSNGQLGDGTITTRLVPTLVRWP